MITKILINLVIIIYHSGNSVTVSVLMIYIQLYIYIH